MEEKESIAHKQVAALTRCVRFGEENSVLMQKLRAHVKEVADEVCEIVVAAELTEFLLPRDYVVLIDDEGTWFCDDTNTALNHADVTRAMLLDFTKALSQGWLDELETFLHNAADETEAATRSADAAKRQLEGK